MHTLEFPITKAAHKRFSLLRRNAELPLPLSREQTAPFGFRFGGRFLCITHKGRDIAYVSDEFTEDETAVVVVSPLPANDTADTAIRRTLIRIVAHLDTVSKVLRQEERDRKAAQKAVAPPSDPFARLRGEDVTGWVRGVSLEDMTFLSEVEMNDDALFGIVEHGERFVLFDSQNRSEIRYHAGEGAFRFTENGGGFSAAALGAYLAELCVWARANNDPRLIAEALSALPPAEFSIAAYAVDTHRPRATARGKRDLPHGVRLVFTKTEVGVFRDGAEVLSYGVPHHYDQDPAAVPRTVKACMPERWQDSPVFERNAEGVDAEVLSRMGSAWIHAMSEADPDFNPSKYAVADLDCVVADADRMDAGYGI